MPCLQSKNWIKNNGTLDGSSFKIPVKRVQTGFTSGSFKLGPVGSEEAHPGVPCGAFAPVQ